MSSYKELVAPASRSIGEIGALDDESVDDWEQTTHDNLATFDTDTRLVGIAMAVALHQRRAAPAIIRLLRALRDDSKDPAAQASASEALRELRLT